MADWLVNDLRDRCPLFCSVLIVMALIVKLWHKMFVSHNAYRISCEQVNERILNERVN